jgi:hypothetical protein
MPFKLSMLTYYVDKRDKDSEWLDSGSPLTANRHPSSRLLVAQWSVMTETLVYL